MGRKRRRDGPRPWPHVYRAEETSMQCRAWLVRRRWPRTRLRFPLVLPNSSSEGYFSHRRAALASPSHRSGIKFADAHDLYVRWFLEAKRAENWPNAVADQAHANLTVGDGLQPSEVRGYGPFSRNLGSASFPWTTPPSAPGRCCPSRQSHERTSCNSNYA